jgi:hypothetical protein
MKRFGAALVVVGVYAAFWAIQPSDSRIPPDIESLAILLSAIGVVGAGWELMGPRCEVQRRDPHTVRTLPGGALEKMMLADQEFARSGPLSLDGFTGSGADWLERYKPFIEDGKTIVASPHKVYGPQTNDLVLQLRKRRIGKVILAGMLANMCVESHLRELLEQGFEVTVVKDATAAPQHPAFGDGYQAAVINYRYLADAVLSTEEAVRAMG